MAVQFRSYRFASLIFLLLLCTSAWGQDISTGPHLDISAAHIPIPAETEKNSSLQMISVSITDAASSKEAGAIILDHLSPQQISQTVVVSEDPQVLAEMKARYSTGSSTVRSAPAFFPVGELAETPASYQSVQHSPLGRIWQQARDWSRAARQPLQTALAERVQFLSSPSHRVDAVYYVVISVLRTYGWLFIKGNSVSPAHFNATVGTVSNLAFYQAQSVLYSIVPNKFANLTAWTTRQLRRAKGQDLNTPASAVWKVAGNVVSQAAINTTSMLLNALDPQNTFFTRRHVSTILLSSFTATSTDYLIQRVYAKFGQMKEERASDMEMTNFFLRRLGLVAGILSMSLAPTPQLQKLDHTAWIVQGAQIAFWIYVDLNFEHIAKFAETSGAVRQYAKFENYMSHAPDRLKDFLFKPETCLTLFGGE